MTLQKYPIRGPFKGVVTDLPATLDDQAFDDVQNMFCRHGRLQTRPAFAPNVAPPDNNPVRGLYTFEDVQNFFHTLVLTSSNAYFLTNPSGTIVYNQLTYPAGLGNLSGTGLPFAIRELNQQVYFCNGSTPLLYVDGSANVQVAGDVPGGCFFLTENAFHLIGAFWVEPAAGQVGSTQYPFRVRWSDSGNPQEWTSLITNTAGAADLIESGGQITGITTVGRNTYILRKYGASVMYPTGQQSAPFSIEPFMWSNPGWGNFYPYSLVTFGPICINITESGEVLLFDGSSFNKLASGKIRAQLQTDLALVSNDVVQCFATASLGPGYDLEAYWISIPGPNIVWVHDLTEGTWQRITSSKGYLTSIARVAVH